MIPSEFFSDLVYGLDRDLGIYVACSLIAIAFSYLVKFFRSGKF